MYITLPWGQDNLNLKLPETWQVLFPKGPDFEKSSQKQNEIVKAS